jgi:hypothetical protein
VALSVDLHLSHLVEGAVFYQILETELSEHSFKTLVVSQTEILAVAGALNFEAIESENHAHNCKCD